MFGPATSLTTVGFPDKAVRVLDVDGDGDNDVLVGEFDGASWYANDGTGHFGQRQIITNAPLSTASMKVADIDGDGVDDLLLASNSPGHVAWFKNSRPAFAAFCFGDGTGTICPCGNAGHAGNGCGSSVNPNGARLSGSGTVSIASDTFVLTGSGMPDSSVLYFQGTLRVNAGNGAVFGDGLRCVGGTVIRIGTKTNVAGTSSYPAAGDAHVALKCNDAPGDVRDYQCWYRNAAQFCSGATFNLSNGLETTWAP
jgi:hypothetical protein